MTKFDEARVVSPAASTWSPVIGATTVGLMRHLERSGKLKLVRIEF